ncbi:hypothetical protein GQ43DRAFT_440052 [Delitschia confertaspora ATCC 74209]|uniref:Uncharacterized protein n=1 Tax=Delitschia confertaspora ATCC 74209 TaxID=1513339 RepID=A0A9P4JMJ7_9PLEO|nr:hypothetical protein GQ43DRAFT_440052 [Delitschia confertaspora ATCC 74209]
MNAANTDAANADLDYQCRNIPTVQKSYIYYSIHGNIVAFFCALGAASQCNAAERSDILRQITGLCGSYIPGWYTYSNSRWRHGYDSGRCFCDQCG